jgi:hypothetical protein
MPDEVEATAAAAGDGFPSFALVVVLRIELGRGDGQGWMKRRDRHDALLR